MRLEASTQKTTKQKDTQMVEKIIIGVNAVFFVSKLISVYKNAQYVKTGVSGHMKQGMTEREATYFEHGYANHDEPAPICQVGNCAALA